MANLRLHTYCAMCTSRCGVVATVEDGILKQVHADPEHPNGCICVKGSAAPEIVYSPDRLQYPMRRTRPKGEKDPGWVRISWDEAMALVASRLLDIKARYGPEAVVFSRSTPAGSASIDFLPWLQRLTNAFGSPNVMCPPGLIISSGKFHHRITPEARARSVLPVLMIDPISHSECNSTSSPDVTPF